MSEREGELSVRENAVGDREEAARRATDDAQGIRKEIERWALSLRSNTHCSNQNQVWCVNIEGYGFLGSPWALITMVWLP